MDLGKNLKQLRVENNLSQAQVAEILHVSRVNYNRYENNKRKIDIESLKILADFYKVSLDEICE